MAIFKGFFTLKKKAYKKAVNGYVPKSVTIPLAQDSNVECIPIVKEGDRVEEGELIATLKNQSLVSNIYSSVPGTVESFLLSPTPDGFYSKAVKIKTGGKFKFLGKKKSEIDINSFSSEQIIESLQKAGILNTFYASKIELLYSQIQKCVLNHKNLLVVRLFDEDVTRISDSLLSEFFLDKILEGTEIICKALGAKGVIFVLDNKFPKKEEIKISSDFRIVQVDSKNYPNGFYEQIISQVKKTFTEEPYKNLSKNDLFVDSSTLLEVFRCVKYNMPVVDRYVHVSGECISFSGMIKVCIGTTFESLAEQCGGFVKKPGAIIVNGLLLGSSSSSLKSTVTKYVKSVSFLPVIRKPLQHNSECIHCGNCRKVCPLFLSPDVLYRHASGGQGAQIEYLKSAKICSNCGLCNSYCPSRLPISQKILELKNKLQKKEELNESK